MIIFKNINLKFGDKLLFENLNFKINDGEHTAIKGRSGKGKTSLFNMLMGFIMPDSGEISVSNLILNHSNVSKIRKKIAWLPQNPSITGRGKVIEQILMPFSFSFNKHLSPSIQLLKDELKKLNLDSSILENTFEEISGGEKQRIAILICKLLQRDVILLDEPTSSLDKENLNSVIEYFRIHPGFTILSASHDDEWLSHCNNIIEL